MLKYNHIKKKISVSVLALDSQKKMITGKYKLNIERFTISFAYVSKLLSMTLKFMNGIDVEPVVGAAQPTMRPRTAHGGDLLTFRNH